MSTHAFECYSCRKTFYVDMDSYRGEYDHEGGDCRCEPCKEREGQFIGRRWFPGTEDESCRGKQG